MKYLICLILICIYCIFTARAQSRLPPSVREGMEKCKVEFKVTDASIKDGTVDKCYFLCIGQKLGAFDNNGKFFMDNVHKMYPAEFVKKVEGCANTAKNENNCEMAQKFIACIL